MMSLAIARELRATLSIGVAIFRLPHSEQTVLTETKLVSLSRSRKTLVRSSLARDRQGNVSLGRSSWSEESPNQRSCSSGALVYSIYYNSIVLV